VDLLDRAFAAAYDPVLASAERAGLAQLRRDLLGDLAGVVVEIGAGTGGNLAAYGPDVEQLVLCEPSPAMLRRLQATVRTSDRTDVTVHRAPAEALPVADGAADVVVSTLVLCTVEDLGRSLDEVTRVLRPGGQLVLLEHVAAADAATARLQRVLARPWRAMARGCRLSSDPRTALVERGYDVDGLHAQRLPLPAPARPGLVGIAVRR
jgi:SAM-dependent methyltransferase